MWPEGDAWDLVLVTDERQPQQEEEATAMAAYRLQAQGSKMDEEDFVTAEDLLMVGRPGTMQPLCSPPKTLYGRHALSLASVDC